MSDSTSPLSPTTLWTYRAQIKQTIRPRLGKVLLSRLSARNLDELYGTMKGTRASPKTIRNHHAIIAALHQGVRWGWVRYNVAERAKPPRVEHRQVQAPSVDVFHKVIDAAEKGDPRLAPLLMPAALTGMRRGELCALRWSDVDLQLGIVNVSRSLAVVSGGVSEKTTKTERSRKVALDPFEIALLTEHRARVDEWVLTGVDGILGTDRSRHPITLRAHQYEEELECAMKREVDEGPKPATHSVPPHPRDGSRHPRD
ncbi:MAG: site-specific integrase [Acidimicrobiales bacterium]